MTHHQAQLTSAATNYSRIDIIKMSGKPTVLSGPNANSNPIPNPLPTGMGR